MEIEINYKGVLLLVGGTYEPGEEGELYDGDMCGTPPTPGLFDINEVFVEETDIYEMLSYEILEELQELILNKIEE